MTFTSGFFDAVAHDRLYNTLQISSIFDGVITDGVYAAIGDHFMVVENTGMNVAVGTGRAWFNHTWSYNDADIVLAISAAHPLQDRFDVVALEINSEVGTRANSVKVITGTPSADPQIPALTNTEYVHQKPLAYIEVLAGSTTIGQAYIINKVGSLDCPFVTGPLSVITTNELLIQWEAEFNDWFDHIMDHLSEEAAGDLQLQIDAVVGDLNPPAINLLELKTHKHIAGDLGGYIDHLGIAPDGIWEGNLGYGCVRESKIHDGAVTENKIADGAVTVNKIGPLAITSGKLATSSVIAGKISTGGVNATSQLANDIVDDTKVGNRVPQFYRRQGGSSTDWSLAGINNYAPGYVRQLGGVARWTGPSDTNGILQVNFPIPFSNPPIVIATVRGTGGGQVGLTVYSEAADRFYIEWRSNGISLTVIDFTWLASGPE